MLAPIPHDPRPGAPGPLELPARVAHAYERAWANRVVHASMRAQEARGRGDEQAAEQHSHEAACALACWREFHIPNRKERQWPQT